jgi:hypothetical protein
MRGRFAERRRLALKETPFTDLAAIIRSGPPPGSARLCGLPGGSCSYSSSDGGTPLKSRSPVRPTQPRRSGGRHSGCDAARLRDTRRRRGAPMRRSGCVVQDRREAVWASVPFTSGPRIIDAGESGAEVACNPARTLWQCRRREQRVRPTPVSRETGRGSGLRRWVRIGHPRTQDPRLLQSYY